VVVCGEFGVGNGAAGHPVRVMRIETVHRDFMALERRALHQRTQNRPHGPESRAGRPCDGQTTHPQTGPVARPGDKGAREP
jgi:hypothetical protein